MLVWVLLRGTGRGGGGGVGKGGGGGRKDEEKAVVERRKERDNYCRWVNVRGRVLAF